MRVERGLDMLALDRFKALCGKAETGSELLFAANRLLELVVGFDSSWLSVAGLRDERKVGSRRHRRASADRQPPMRSGRLIFVAPLRRIDLPRRRERQ
jgi:hypothetical protein